jgi:hypothetical protein
MLWIAAIGACLGTIILWDLAVVAALRLFGIMMPFSVAFRIYPRREHELFAALKGNPKATYVFISGFLLFACPLFAGLTLFDYVAHGAAPHGPNYIVGSILVFALTIACGVLASVSNWNKSCGNLSSKRF